MIASNASLSKDDVIGLYGQYVASRGPEVSGPEDAGRCCAVRGTYNFFPPPFDVSTRSRATDRWRWRANGGDAATAFRVLPPVKVDSSTPPQLEAITDRAHGPLSRLGRAQCWTFYGVTPSRGTIADAMAQMAGVSAGNT